MQTEPQLSEVVDNPKHDCPALGKNVIVLRAFNSADPNKMFYMCPFCSYLVEPLTEKGDHAD